MTEDKGASDCRAELERNCQFPGGLRLTVVERCELHDWKDACVSVKVAEAITTEREACEKLCDLMSEVLIARRDDALTNGNTDAALTLARQAQTADDLADAIVARSNADVTGLAPAQETTK